MGKNGPFIDDVPIKTFIYKGFSMAMLNNQLVNAMQSHIAMKFSINSQHLGQTPSVPHRRGAGSEREHQWAAEGERLRAFSSLKAMVMFFLVY